MGPQPDDVVRILATMVDRGRMAIHHLETGDSQAALSLIEACHIAWLNLRAIDHRVARDLWTESSTASASELSRTYLGISDEISQRVATTMERDLGLLTRLRAARERLVHYRAGGTGSSGSFERGV